ncbi:hypothetical protein [Sinorhizobium meliloti]|uniref:hypothetical protein n=1 Tax=Rhizobium meliloti TaxID=382 RepID=UPI00028612C0|nr:hypothetical protein [Sinorhizobium meliloti]MDX0437106.1 hypothetical protein [Sinorhizobium medicae]MQW16668.1 hypothetical protein [Sinorhizobium meliloti]RVI70098.1 hypothetical protein CN189_01775 [Sinorhizobium meliloti]CCM68188.1 hypothetical protein BN406_02143 [Sinorhizobium meliloti Rm41]
MKTETKLIGIHVHAEFAEEVDAVVGKGQPGDPGYFANRSDVVKCAIRRFLAEINNSQEIHPNIRKRARSVQRVASA